MWDGSNGSDLVYHAGASLSYVKRDSYYGGVGGVPLPGYAGFDPQDYAEALEASLASIDTLLLVSGMDAPERRIEQHRNVIRAAQNAGVQKLVYTSVQGAEEGTAFSPIIQSNRQTEEDVRNSGLEWAIGRNGIYIEPDVEYFETYKERGEIAPL